MGSFSFMYADGGEPDKANVVPGDAVRVLVPAEFGGGAVEGVYVDYGIVELADGSGSVDVYELLAMWNSYEVRKAAEEGFGLRGRRLARKTVDGVFTPFARIVAIDAAEYDSDMVCLKYPLKIVPAGNRRARYGSVTGVSVADPYQGFDAYPWSDLGLGDSLDDYIEELRAGNELAGSVVLDNIALSARGVERMGAALSRIRSM